ncbi:MAG: restriction endonuclease subunit S [Gammaproteobacteria bacterium]|nr:restriction endonuclease subunit S [Gammaproteobacteria bacterium]
MNWEMKPVSELCEFAIDCVNKTAPIVDYETPYKMIRTTNVKGGFIDLNTVRYVEEETFKVWTRRSKPQYGDVIFTREAPVGDVGRFTSNDTNVFLGQRLFHYRPNPDLLDWQYLAYVLQSEAVQGWVHGIAFGATVPHIKVDDAENLKIPCPPIDVQKRIGSILSAYDDLIENNLSRIKLLEEMMQITYEEWFVRLKYPGHESKSIDPESGLPEEWHNSKLGDSCTLIMGQSPKSEYYNYEELGIPFHQGVKDFGNRFPINTCWTTEGKRTAIAGDILFSVRAPVGRLNVALEAMVLGRGLSAIRHKGGSQSFLFYQLQNIFFKEDMMGGGAIFASVTKNDMLKINLTFPSEDIQEKFDVLASSADEIILALFKQNQYLKEARDILLPRLMKGMIDVNKIKLPKELLERTEQNSQAQQLDESVAAKESVA